MIRIALALLVGLAACPASGAPGPGDEPPDESADPEVRLEFSARQLETGGEAGVRAEGGEGRIVVQGALQTPDPCQRVTGTASRSGDEVTLRVESVREGEMCAQVIATFGYDATLSGLAPGTYRLRVVHAYPGTGWETQTALEETVRVR